MGAPGLEMLTQPQRGGAPGLAFETWETTSSNPAGGPDPGGAKRVPPQMMRAPGPSHLGTRDSDTMRPLVSIRVPDTSTMLPAGRLFRAASGPWSVSTGKERDSESGNDYF